MKDYNIIIPARYHSTRLASKLVKEINHKSIIQYVYERCIQSNAKEVVIATDHEKIAAIAKKINAKCVMTSEKITSGTERVAEACRLLKWDLDSIVLNVQGDEPSIPTEVIELAFTTHAENISDSQMSTIAVQTKDEGKLQNPNIVKVVLDKNNRALYFSRYPIPFNREGLVSSECYQHIGIYAYQVQYLQKYVQYSVSPLAQIEVLEQLKALENGDEIKVAIYNKEIDGGIDTIEDFDAFSSKMERESNKDITIN